MLSGKKIFCFLLLLLVGGASFFFFFFNQTAYVQEKNRPAVGLMQRPFLEKIYLPSQNPQLYPLKAVPAFPFRFKLPIFFHPLPLKQSQEIVVVVEQEGLIWSFENRETSPKPSLFLDIKSRVGRYGKEEGLLGLAFHPQYEENGYFYVYYSVTGKIPGSVLSRFTALPSRLEADPKSEVILMEIPQPYRNHNGGGLLFGPDGYLYLSLGDGGFANDPHNYGQDLSSLLGSILRIDVNQPDSGKKYGIPKDNPFRDRKNARGEIWAYGLRNVWRFSFDRETGQMWAGDVGQNRYEEIDIIVKGGNYGWKIREGKHDFSSPRFSSPDPLIDPVYEYPHSLGLSITGGYVYRGKKFPEFYGAYIYADFQTRRVWALWYDGHEVIKQMELFVSPGLVASFGEDTDGELYLCCFNGMIYRFEYENKELKEPEIPKRLSETGLFRDMNHLTPNLGLIPYSVNSPLWSDSAEKIRYLAVPNGKQILFSEQNPWTFPTGSFFVKHFQIEMEEGNPKSTKRLETRVLMLAAKGWEGYTYRWDETQKEAYLLEKAETVLLTRKDAQGKTFQQNWYFPSRTDCFSCHTEASGFVLGVHTAQMNKTHFYPRGEFSQLETFETIGLFKPNSFPTGKKTLPQMVGLEKHSASLEQRAFSYLASNCAFCHQPEGPGNSSIDLRLEIPFVQKKLLNAFPTQGDLGVPEAKILVPKEPEKSLLWLRMNILTTGRMPPIASHQIDSQAIQVLKQWIQQMK